MFVRVRVRLASCARVYHNCVFARCVGWCVVVIAAVFLVFAPVLIIGTVMRHLLLFVPLQDFVGTLRVFGTLAKWFARPFAPVFINLLFPAAAAYLRGMDEDALRTVKKDAVTEVFKHLRAILCRAYTPAQAAELWEVRALPCLGVCVPVSFRGVCVSYRGVCHLLRSVWFSSPRCLFAWR